MSRLEVPFKHRTLWATGDLLLRAELDFFLKDRWGRGGRRRSWSIREAR
jgi:hypothetical protein